VNRISIKLNPIEQNSKKKNSSKPIRQTVHLKLI